MIVRLRRVSLHPFLWLQIVQMATAHHTARASVETRRHAATIAREIRQRFDPDDGSIASPYVRLSTAERKRREDANAKAAAADPTGYRNAPGYLPIPNPDARTSIDLEPGTVAWLREAVEGLAAMPAHNNEIAEGVLDVLDGLDAAAVVEVDTERVS